MLNLENVKTVAYVEPQGSFCDMAKDYFCEKYNIKAFDNPLKTIKQVVDYVDENPDAIGILPIENSVEGTVRETLDNLMDTKNPNVRILAEHYMPIELSLLSRTTEFYSITGLISPPNILAKCHDFICNEMPFNVNIIEASSPPEAARSLQNYNLTYACIGSSKIAELYNLNILKKNIGDDKTNQSRFVIIGDSETLETGLDRSSIAFSTNNEPGALLNVLDVFKCNNINLSYISSHISKKQFGEYIFIINFDGHINNPKVLATLNKIKETTDYFRFLGSYKKSKLIINNEISV